MSTGAASAHPTPRASEGSGVRARFFSPGDRVGGRYEIRRTLGAGGWAVVYEAEHVVLRHRVAIKVLRPGEERHDVVLERFRREARICATIRHPNVLEVYDVGHLPDGSPYLVMELLNGEDLDSRLATGPLHVAEVIDVGVQLLSALAELHGRGVLHRDIKPHNLFLHEGDDGELTVKLLDFGISQLSDPWTSDAAKLTSEGELVGTPHYMAPEQLLAEPLDVRTDLYATSVVLYELLTGRAPFEEATQGALIASILRDPVPDLHALCPGCPEELAAVILRGLAKERSERWADPAEMRSALCGVREALGLPEGTDAWSPAARMVRRDGLPLPFPSEADSRGVTRAASGSPRTRRRRRRWAALAIYALAALALPLAYGAVSGGPPPLDGLATKTADAKHRPARGEPEPDRSRESAAEAAPSRRVAREADDDAPSRRVARERTPVEPPERAEASRAQEPSRPSAPVEDLRRRALAAYVRGKLPEARALYRRALRAAPADAESWRGLGMVALAMGRADEASRALHRYLRLAPDARDAPRIRARLAAATP